MAPEQYCKLHPTSLTGNFSISCFYIQKSLHIQDFPELTLLFPKTHIPAEPTRGNQSEGCRLSSPRRDKQHREKMDK